MAGSTAGDHGDGDGWVRGAVSEPIRAHHGRTVLEKAQPGLQQDEALKRFLHDVVRVIHELADHADQ